MRLSVRHPTFLRRNSPLLTATAFDSSQLSQGLDTDHSNPTSRLLLQVLAAVAKFERELIRERTLSGVRAARANGKISGRRNEFFAGMQGVHNSAPAS
jgi:Resolvase, N terminal domain